LTSLVETLLQGGEDRLYEQVIAAVERVLFTRVLRHTHGHLGQASVLLGLNRATLRHRLRALRIGVDKTLIDTPKSDPDAT
jgi:DNA-binding protein Fis